MEASSVRKRTIEPNDREEFSEPQPKKPRLPKAKPDNSSRTCGSCNSKFSSVESLEFHTKTKSKALLKRKIDPDEFKPMTQLLVCKIDGCCFSTGSETSALKEMGIHMMGEKHNNTDQLKRSKEVVERGGFWIPTVVYAIERGSGKDYLEGQFQCGSCGIVLKDQRSKDRHMVKPCQGRSPWNCMICGHQHRSREDMIKHLKIHHSSIPGIWFKSYQMISPFAGLNITGVFTGTPKDFVRSNVVTKRKGVNIGGLDKSSIKTYTFIPPRATALTAREVFADKQLESLESVIQLSRSQAGAYVVNINTASLLETTKSKQLEVFNTQSKIRPFSATVNPSLVIAHIFSAVDMASRQVTYCTQWGYSLPSFFFIFCVSQAADASSGLSLRTIKSVSITIGPASGRRGAGWKDNRHPSTRHRHWANNLKIRGAKSIEVTEQDVAEDPSYAIKCFQHTVLHQVI